ncbi:MAG: hypothetical protein LBC19_09275 [Tannerella sp.]|nr:hypothetical protein [Tannerella sp.]
MKKRNRKLPPKRKPLSNRKPDVWQRNSRKHNLSEGIAESHILGVASKRDTQPLLPDTNGESRKKNRRVEVVVQ